MSHFVVDLLPTKELYAFIYAHSPIPLPQKFQPVPGPPAVELQLCTTTQLHQRETARWDKPLATTRTCGPRNQGIQRLSGQRWLTHAYHPVLNKASDNLPHMAGMRLQFQGKQRKALLAEMLN